MKKNNVLTKYTNLNRFAVLQLSEGENVDQNKRYASFSPDVEYTADDYEISFFEENKSGYKLNLEDLFARFNGLQPSTYYGHSVSISDVILESYNGEINAYYVDNFGFEKLDESFITDKVLKRFEYGLDVHKEYICINNNAKELQEKLGAGFNSEERKEYLEENYGVIFEMAEIRKIREIILKNQNKLQAIYESEKGLPFKFIEQKDGFYTFDVKNKTVAEVEKFINDEYERVQPIKNVTVHFRYNEEKRMNGWGSYVDEVTFDDVETAMKYINKKEAVYDYLDNYMEVRYDETPLYMTDENDKVIWENESYAMFFTMDVRDDKLSNEDIMTNLHIMQGMKSVNDFSITVYGDKLPVNSLRRIPYEDGYISYQIGNVEFTSDDIEKIEYKDGVLRAELKYRGIGNVEADLIREGGFNFNSEELSMVLKGIRDGENAKAGTYIHLNELDSRFDNNIIQLGVDIIEYDYDRECYAWYRETDHEMHQDYYTYFEVDDIKAIFVGEEQIKNYYTKSELAEIKKSYGLTYVAIESTEDYSDSNFHQELMDIDIQNEDGSYGKVKDSYRLVAISSNGLLASFDNNVYSSEEEARASIDTSKYYEIGYDDIVYKAGFERQNYIFQMQENNQLLDKYEVKGFEFPLREDYSDKYLVNLCSALKEYSKKGYSDKAVVELAKAKSRYIDVDKALNSLPLIKKANLVATVNGVEFYSRNDNPTLVMTYRENYNIDNSEDVRKACERIYSLNDYSGFDLIMQDEAYRQRKFSDEEILSAINKEKGVVDFKELGKMDYVVLDVETTGFNKDDEVVEIGIINKNSEVLYESMFEPYKELSKEASAVNNIAMSDLEGKPRFDKEFGKILNAVGDKPIVIYNKLFDTKMILQTAEIHSVDNALIDKLKDKFDNNTYCAMQSYAELTNNYKTTSLNNALKDNNIEVVQSHRAVDDCLDTLKLVKACSSVEKENNLEVTQDREEFNIVPIQEFIKDGKIYTGEEISGFNINRSDGIGFSDRRLVYNAVKDFQEANKDFPNLPQALDENGGYEDKDFLYSAYDEYLALSHRNELKEYEARFDDYVENVLNNAKEHNYTLWTEDKYILKLPVLAEVYYAKASGLSDEQIDYMIDSTNKSDAMHFEMRNIWKAFDNGLSIEQIEIAKDFNSSDKDIILEMIADGSTVEQINTLKGFNYNVILPMRFAYKHNYITVEQGQAICESVKNCVDNGKLEGGHALEYFIEGITQELKDNPQPASTITNTFNEFLIQDKHEKFWDFIEEKGWVEQSIPLGEEKNMSEHTIENNVNIETNDEVNEKDNLKDKLKEGVKNTLDSENFARWCQKQGRLYYNNYSLNNAFLTYMQNPEASYVCGYEQWKDYGRQVQKGAKGIKIFSPIFVQEKYGKGSLYNIIKKTCNEQIRSGAEYGTFSLQGTKLFFNMQKNGLFDVKVGDKTYLAHATAEEFKKFLDRSVIGKVPRGYNVVTVFDINDTTKDAEFLWVRKENCKKEEIVLDKNGEPIRNNRGQYKIYNTDERRNSFNVPLDITIKDNDNEKLEILYTTLRELSEKKGVPITECEPARDTTLSGGARGYFRIPSEEFPKGNIVISSELPLANKVSTTFHEIAHSDLHTDLEKLKSDMELGEDVVISRQMKEIQAEGVAYMTASNFGLETDHKSFNYIANWSDGRELKALEDSMNIIYKESTKLMKDIEKVLDEKGLSLNLEAKDLTSLNESEKQAFLEPFSDYALNGLRKIETIQKQAFTELKQTDNEQVQTIIKEQIYLTRQAELKLNEIYSRTEKFRDTDDKRTQINLQMQLKALKKQVDDINVSIDELSQERMDLVIENYKNSEKADLRSLLAVDSKEVFKDLAKTHSELNELSDNDLKFLTNSDFIKTEYSKLLDVDNDKFVELSLKHLDDFKSVMYKNKTAVEINWCENWTDKPIFKKDKGYLLHPALANKIITNAEKQIEGLKKVAEKNNEYFPYSKCKLTIHSMTEIKGRDNLSSLVTTVDIGDGEQKDLREHVEQILSKSRSKEKMQILDNFNKSVKERSNINSVEAVHYSDLQTASIETERNNTELNNAQDDISLSMSDWKNEILASDNVAKTNEEKKNKTHVVSNDTKEKE